MSRRSREAGTTDASRDERPSRWGWVAGLAIVLFAFVGLVGAVLLTPGNPFDCKIPNPSAWMLCDWFRTFVTNLVGVLVVLAGGSLVLAFLVATPRAILRAIRN